MRMLYRRLIRPQLIWVLWGVSLLISSGIVLGGDGEGKVMMEPSKPVPVGSFGTWKFTFVVGPSGIKPGGGICLHIPGSFARIFSPPQVDDPKGIGFVTATCTRPGVRLSLKILHYRRPAWIVHHDILVVVHDPLKSGDKIVVVFGDRRFGGPGARVNRLVQAFDVPIPVSSDVDGDGQFANLPDSPKIDVVGTDAVRLDCYAPSNAVSGRPIELTIVARDPYGNVSVGYQGKVKVKCTDDKARFPKELKFSPQDKGLLRFKAVLRSPGFQWFTVESVSITKPVIIKTEDIKPLHHSPLNPNFDPDFRPVLLRMEISAPSARPGSVIGLTFVWRNEGKKPAKKEADYRVFTHLGTRNGRAMANWDHRFPIPMTEWEPGQVVKYTRAVKIPDDAPEGRHQLRVGIYDVASFRQGKNVRLCAYEVAYYPLSRNAPLHRFILPVRSNPVWVVKREPRLRLFWGDLHGHTENSDGTGTIDHYYWYARQVSRLDFAAVSDHVGYGTPEEKWRRFQEGAKRYYEPGRFVTFLACEWSTAWWGDRNIYFLSDKEGNPVPKGTVEDLWRNLEGKRAIVIPHHPAYPIGLRGADWRCHNPQFERLVEIASMHGLSEFYGNPGECGGERSNMGPATPGGFVREALAKGLKLGIIASSDDHSGRPGSSQWGKWGDGYSSPLVAVWAPELTREAIFEALYHRRCYGTTGARMILFFEMDGHEMGDEYATDKPPRVVARVVGTAPIKVLQIVKNGRVVCERAGEGMVSGLEWTDENFVEPYACYYLRVEQVDREIGWSSPIWVNSLAPFPDLTARIEPSFKRTLLRPGMKVKLPIIVENRGEAPASRFTVRVSWGPVSTSWSNERPRWKGGLLCMPRTGMQIWRWRVDENRVNVFFRWLDREEKERFTGTVRVRGYKAYFARPYHFERGDWFEDDGEGVIRFASEAVDALGDGLNLTIDIRPDCQARVWVDVQRGGVRRPEEIWVGKDKVANIPFEFPVSVYRPEALIWEGEVESLEAGEAVKLEVPWFCPQDFSQHELIIWVDPEGKIFEKNCQNNRVCLPLR